MTTFDECTAKKKKWRKAFLTLGFSLTGVWVFGKSVKNAAEEHVPDYQADYLINGEKIRVGYYDSDHTFCGSFGVLFMYAFFLQYR